VRVLVTGGGGFVGGAIVDELLARGHEVTSLSRGVYPELERKGVVCVRADLTEGASLGAAVRGHDAVIHSAARAGIWGPRADYWRTNVEGTRKVLAACLAEGVGRLVYTSSPSVCFDICERETTCPMPSASWPPTPRRRPPPSVASSRSARTTGC
jgi:nucleoside-diphosphate-sugar epimerase